MLALDLALRHRMVGPCPPQKLWNVLNCDQFEGRRLTASEMPIWPVAASLDLQRLIRKMAHENPSWGEERVANELLLKVGMRVSPRTIRKYLPKLPSAP